MSACFLSYVLTSFLYSHGFLYICKQNTPRMKKTIILFTLILCCMTACTGSQKKENSMITGNETLVRLETTMGNITVKLYDETPKHRDNFIKLVKEGVYDSTLFHRVIKNFMIQAGDPQSKTATDTTTTLGTGDVGYTIPAEINPKFFHKRGVLAAARQGDDVNPNRESSGCQFYIVTGRKFSEAQMINMENQLNEARLDTVFQTLARKHMKEIYKMRKANDMEGLMALQDSLEVYPRTDRSLYHSRWSSPLGRQLYDIWRSSRRYGRGSTYRSSKNQSYRPSGKGCTYTESFCHREIG